MTGHRVSQGVIRTWLVVVVLVLWWLLSRGSTSPYFPPFTTILDAVKNLVFSGQQIESNILPSLGRFGAGFALACAFGVALGILLGVSEAARQATEPVLDFFRSMPVPALLPIAITLLGVGNTMKVGLIAFGTVWPVLLNTVDGVRAVDQANLDMARVYGLAPMTRLRRIVIPSALPQAFAGARVALGVGLVLMVISEMQASTGGVGYLVILSQQTFAIPQMWAGIVVLGLIGFLTNLIFVLIERRALAWHRGWKRQQRAA